MRLSHRQNQHHLGDHVQRQYSQHDYYNIHSVLAPNKKYDGGIYNVKRKKGFKV